MATVKAVKTNASLSTAIGYVLREDKTEPRLTYGINCSPATVLEEMKTTKELWNKTSGRQYKHYALSYAPEDNITPRQALKNGVKLAKNNPAWKDFEVLVAVHTDTDKIHIHFIVNSVNCIDGHKLQESSQDLATFKANSDKLCREQGLIIAEKGRHADGTKNTDITTYDSKKQKALELHSTGKAKSWLVEIAQAVQSAKANAVSKSDFINRLLRVGISTTWTDKRKNITFEDMEGNKARAKNLASTFKLEGLTKEELELEFEHNAQITARAEQQLDRANREIDSASEPTSTDNIEAQITAREQRRADNEAKRRKRKELELDRECSKDRSREWTLDR